MYNITMYNPKDTFTNVRYMLTQGLGKDLPSNENKLSNVTTKVLNFVVFASLIVGTIYLIKLFI
jgi:hypothetical protein